MKLEEERDRVRAAALRLLSYRDRSILELKSRLRRKGFHPDVISDEIERLKGEKLLDDERFAGVWIRHKLFISHKGKRLIRAELAAKGIPGDMFTRVWEEHVDHEIRSAREYALKKLASYDLLDSFERRGRIHQILFRRGYSQTAIDKALEEIE
ncbi:hypothetical protein GF359_02240 [candidate division WOR-3 bacterium]|uniref:Regulatory protein RecX n=1 Tax=candidate division WOR-3 bacterium TaxID=2052148 RepID=A0A9D5K831_UNCW3|nr:hypothetical protein [candidate division WOR-3 bacterium]MBD3364013.1 hypothetical protein [candidate division WOR-3 bacterium]